VHHLIERMELDYGKPITLQHYARELGMNAAHHSLRAVTRVLLAPFGAVTKSAPPPVPRLWVIVDPARPRPYSRPMRTNDGSHPPHALGKAARLTGDSPTPAGRPSSLLDTRVIYSGDCLDQLCRLPDACVDLIYIDPPFNSNRNYEVFWGETRERRAFEDRHASTHAYLDYMRPRCVELARVLKKSSSFYYHCDWHASH
jgi:hypothetical protein